MVEESLWKVLGFLLAVILIFVAPTIATYDRMDAITYNVVQSEVAKFCDGVRDTGYISQNSYDALLQTLANTGVGYSVLIEHYEKVYVPIYSGATFMNRYEIVYDAYYNESVFEAFEDPLNGGRYSMAVGDLVYVHVENTSPTKSQTIKQLLLGVNQRYPVIVVRNGGMVRHEPN